MNHLAPHTDQLTTGLISVGPDGRILWCNQAARIQLGLGKPTDDSVSLSDLIPLLEHRLTGIKANQQSVQISEVVLPQTQLSVDLSLTYLDDDIILCELYPITERIRQRQQAERADRQQAIGQMARHLAHELRNPLAGVKAGAQLVVHQSTDPNITRHAGMIERGVDRITALLERFADSQSHKKSQINLHQLLTETAELVVAERRGELRIEPDFDPSIPLLMADGDQLNQLFLNLIRNSSQADASWIQISTRIEHISPIVDPPAKHAIRVVIKDNGTGIPKHLHERLFLPMVTGKDQGSGFGLAIAQQIARAHDGLLEYQPCPEGTSFVLRLPLITAMEAPSIAV